MQLCLWIQAFFKMEIYLFATHMIIGIVVQEIIQKLNEFTGKNYRFPTVAEWEYAARGGNKSKGYRYSGSNDIDEVAWYEGNLLDELGLPIPWPFVGTKKPNKLGIYDMSGLLWEVSSDGCTRMET